MQQQEVMTASINNPGLLLIDIAEKIMQCKEKPIAKKRFPVVKPVKNVSRLLEQEIVKGRTFTNMEEKWAFEERLERGHK